MSLTIRPNEAGERLDKILAARYPEQSRSYFQSLIGQDLVIVDGQTVKKRTKPAAGALVELTFALTEEISLEPEDIPLDVLYEDDYLLIINKPAGLVVHPGPKNWSGTVANALLFRYGDLGDGEKVRPGIVHRLDKETSGLMLCAKSAQAQAKLMKLFADRQMEKSYLAITVGKPREGLVEAAIGRHPKDRRIQIVREDGKSAKTIVKVLGWDENLALAECDLLTGRTHQIRVHLKHIGTPILGDPTYGVVRTGFRRQMLHAERLAFTHPFSGKRIEMHVLPPADMLPTCRKLYPEIDTRCASSSNA